MEPLMQLKHPKGKKSVSMDKAKYKVLEEAILHCLKSKGESTHKEILKAVDEYFKMNKTNFEGSVEWHMEWVKLDLEAKNIIKRLDDKTPVKFAIQMKNKTLEIKAAIQISKPVHEVFEAIADPKKMSNYFIAEGSGKMEEGKQLTWKFPEFEPAFPIQVGKIETDKYISYHWESDGVETLVEIVLTSVDSNISIVTVTEKSMDNDEAGIKWLKSNTEGWANFLACLKAYLEFGINLRKGAFDFMKS